MKAVKISDFIKAQSMNEKTLDNGYTFRVISTGELERKAQKMRKITKTVLGYFPELKGVK